MTDFDVFVIITNMKLIDTHSHIHFCAYDDDREAVLARSRERDIAMITVGTLAETSRSAIEFAQMHSDVYATVGLHPNYASGQDYIDEMEEEKAVGDGGHAEIRREIFDPREYLEMAKHPKVVAIGETGLDYFHFPKGADVELAKKMQKDVLREHIKIAQSVGKPLVVHCRDAHADLLQVLKETDSEYGVIHCFTGSLEEARAYVALGFHISFTGVITFPPRKSAPEVQQALLEVVRQIPIESILIETDAPYLAPVPHRGERNEPAFVSYVAEKIAEIKGVSFDEVARVTTQNAKKLFGIM